MAPFWRQFCRRDPAAGHVAKRFTDLPQEPRSAVILAGTNFTFNASATGTPPLTCQWLRNHVALPRGDECDAVLDQRVARPQRGVFARCHEFDGRRFEPDCHAPGAEFSVPATAAVALRRRVSACASTTTTAGRSRSVKRRTSRSGSARIWLPPTGFGGPPTAVTNRMLILDDSEAPQHPRRFYRLFEP